MEWTVVTALVVIVGLFLSIGTPILKLNSNIVRLNVTLEAQDKRIEENKEDLEKQKQHAHECHKSLWDHNKEQDEQLAEHDRRIEMLEKQ